MKKMFTVNCLRLLFTRIFYNIYFKMFYFFCKHFYYYIILLLFFLIFLLLYQRYNEVNLEEQDMITKFGNAYQRKDGYYQISSGIHQGKLLHRLIYEENFGAIPEGFICHHIDGNKENNDPKNLMLLSKSNHHHLHSNGVNHPRWNHGRIDEYGGINFISASKNKGMNMQAIADECGYSNVSSVFHYLDKRGLRWNQL